jgi:hypothetical protein
MEKHRLPWDWNIKHLRNSRILGRATDKVYSSPGKSATKGVDVELTQIKCNRSW